MPPVLVSSKLHPALISYCHCLIFLLLWSLELAQGHDESKESSCYYVGKSRHNHDYYQEGEVEFKMDQKTKKIKFCLVKNGEACYPSDATEAITFERHVSNCAEAMYFVLLCFILDYS